MPVGSDWLIEGLRSDMVEEMRHVIQARFANMNRSKRLRLYEVPEESLAPYCVVSRARYECCLTISSNEFRHPDYEISLPNPEFRRMDLEIEPETGQQDNGAEEDTYRDLLLPQSHQNSAIEEEVKGH